MQISNPFLLKDWKIKDFLMLITTSLTLFFIFILLDYIGLNTTPFREIIGFLIALYIPGTIFLRLLNLETKNYGKIFLYTIGTSLFILMSMGFLINTLYPLFGIETPLSFESIIITLTSFIIIFSFLCYLKDRQSKKGVSKGLDNIKHNYLKVNLKSLISIPTLFPILIPILSILGAYMLNVYQSNILTIIMILLIALLAFTVSINKLIPTKTYPLIIFAISLALVLHKSLITNYIWGWDINGEYFLANQILLNSYWNVNFPSNYNSMLSVMILAPILSNVIKLNLVWIMKIVYPFLFSLVPTGLYYVYYKQTCPKIAFFSAFFFMILFTFYTEMLSVARQQVAELFLVLLLMLLVSDDLDKFKKSLLTVVFGLSIIVSHYGLSYLLMIILIISALTLYILDKNLINRFFTSFYKLNMINMIFKPISTLSNSTLNQKFSYKEPTIMEKIEEYQEKKQNHLIITSFFLSLFILFILIWYLYTSNSSIFQSFMDIWQSIISNLYSFMDPTNTQGLSLVVQTQTTLIKNIHKYLYLFSEFLIFIGVLSLLLGMDGMKFKEEYKALSIASLIILIAGIVLPLFSSQMNTSRLYHIALIFLAPFCILGIIKSMEILKILFKVDFSKHSLFKAISIFLIIFLFFDTGLMYQILDPAQTTSIALNPSYDFPKFNQKEVTAGNWLSNTKYDYPVYADKNRASVLRSMMSVIEIPYYFDLVNNQSYIFLGTWNVEKDQILVYNMIGSNIIINETYFSPINILKGRSKIYDNGGAEIYSPKNS